MQQHPDPLRKSRLSSWKEVGAFFGKSESTVKRWEAERGLPIHRLPGKRSGIFADVAELETWLKSDQAREAEMEGSAELPLPGARKPWLTLPVLAGGCALVVALAAFALAPRWLHATHTPPPAARAFYLKGTSDWQQRTPEALNRAVDEFNQAIAADPDYAQAYAGLATAYNLMPEYTAMPTTEAYPKAAASARHALKLDDRIASAHAALAFSTFYGAGDAKTAQSEYERALRLDPDNADVEHWYATFLMTETDYQGALTHIDRALALNPDSVSIQADRGMIMIYIDPKKAIEMLKPLEVQHPEFHSPHGYLTYAYGIVGDDENFLREMAETARLKGNSLDVATAEAGMKGWKAGGHDGMLRAMLVVKLDQYGHGAVPAYDVAGLYAQLGDNANAMSYLTVAFDRHEDGTIYCATDKRFEALHGRPEYKALLARPHVQT